VRRRQVNDRNYNYNKTIIYIKPPPTTSVRRIHNFHGFLNPGNHQKPAKIQVVEYFETYVLLSRNPAGESWTETWKTHESRKVCSNYWAYIYVRRKIDIKV
jgi:hypothetical protein